MRILVLSWEYPPFVVGGMGKHAAGLITELGGIPTGFGPQQVDVITTRFAGGNPVEQIGDYTTVHRVEMPPVDPLDLFNSVSGANDRLVECAQELAAIHAYDLIHVHDWLPGSAGITLKNLWKTPLVATMHATERGRHQGYISDPHSHQIDELEWQVCHEAWRVIVCSQFMTTELNHYFRTPLDKIIVIPNGIDLAPLVTMSAEEKLTLRGQFAKENERLLFFVGRIVHEKGLQVLLRAMPQITTEFPQTRLLVAGKNSRQMAPLAREMGVADSVRFLDFISNEKRDQLYQIVDAAIFPSLYEPFGIVALEAMALDCNVIASDVGGLGEVVKHMQNGLTVYPNDPQSITWAVRQVFDYPMAAQQRRNRALHQVRHQYNWREIAIQTTRLFEDVVTERRHTPW